MPRLFIILGILFIAGGFVAPFAQVGTFSIPGLHEPTVESLCNPGETLKKSSGGAAHIPGSRTFASYVGYHCVDARGISRDVTAAYLSGLGGETTGFIKQILSSVAISTAAPLLGTLFLVMGIILSVKRGIAAGTMRVVTPMYADITDQVRASGRFGGVGSSSTTAATDPSTRLQQLESMLNSKLITEEEYQAKRREIIDGV